MAMDDVVFFFPLLTKAAGLLGLCSSVWSNVACLLAFAFALISIPPDTTHTRTHALARRRATCGVRSIDASGAAGGSRSCLLFASEATPSYYSRTCSVCMRGRVYRTWSISDYTPYPSTLYFKSHVPTYYSTPPPFIHSIQKKHKGGQRPLGV